MENSGYKGFRPHYMKHKPLLLDYLHAAWVLLMGLLKRKQPTNPLPKQNLDFSNSSIIYADASIICIPLEKKVNLIDPFFTLTNTFPSDRFFVTHLPVNGTPSVGIRRDRISELVNAALKTHSSSLTSHFQALCCKEILKQFGPIYDHPNTNFRNAAYFFNKDQPSDNFPQVKLF